MEYNFPILGHLSSTYSGRLPNRFFSYSIIFELWSVPSEYLRTVKPTFTRKSRYLCIYQKFENEMLKNKWNANLQYYNYKIVNSKKTIFVRRPPHY